MCPPAWCPRGSRKEPGVSTLPASKRKTYSFLPTRGWGGGVSEEAKNTVVGTFTINRRYCQWRLPRELEPPPPPSRNGSCPRGINGGHKLFILYLVVTRQCPCHPSLRPPSSRDLSEKSYLSIREV